MLTADHPNALWLAEVYGGDHQPDASAEGLTKEEHNRLRAEKVKKHMERMSPDLIIHTSGVRLAVTGDMAFLKAYGPRRASLSDSGDVAIIEIYQILADDNYGILHFRSRTTRGDKVWERDGMGAWRFEDGMAVEHWELGNGPKWDAWYLEGDPDFNGDPIEFWTRGQK